MPSADSHGALHSCSTPPHRSHTLPQPADPYPTPSPTFKPASAASRYTGPHRYVYSNDWKELYQKAGDSLRQNEFAYTEDEVVELVLNAWDAVRAPPWLGGRDY